MGGGLGALPTLYYHAAQRHKLSMRTRLDEPQSLSDLQMRNERLKSPYMAGNNPQFDSLKQCYVSCESLAKEINVPKSFIVEQKRVEIDTVSKFSHGAFAKVICAKYLGANVRVKRIHAILTESNRLDMYRFLQECRLASDLRHPNIVHFYGVVMDGRLPMLVMEELVCSLHEFIHDPEKRTSLTVFNDLYVPDFKTSRASNKDGNTEAPANSRPHNEIVSGAEASEYSVGARGRHDSEMSATESDQKCQNIDTHKKIVIALEIAQGLAYLHTKKPYPIVHRDLSSSNVLLGVFSHKIVAKIADFGQSKEIKAKGDWSSRNPGTVAYLPPEVLVPTTDTNTNCHEDHVQPHAPSDNIHTVPVCSQSRQHRVSVGNAELSIFHLAWEPDNVRTRSSSQEGAAKSKPLLKTSIDMYMYGILCVEMSSEQLPHTWRASAKESWHTYHMRKLKTIAKDELLYGIAKHCIIENPDMRAEAAFLVHFIARLIDSTPPKSAAPAQNQVSISCMLLYYVNSLILVKAMCGHNVCKI